MTECKQDNQIPVGIIGLGNYLPARVVRNDHKQHHGGDHIDEQLSEIFRGSMERRFASEGETSVEFGVKASMEAVKDAGLTPADIDILLVSSAVQQGMAW